MNSKLVSKNPFFPQKNCYITFMRVCCVFVRFVDATEVLFNLIIEFYFMITQFMINDKY